MTSLGTPYGVRNWNKCFFWVKVPEDYPIPMGFVSPCLRMAGIETLVGLLQEDEAFSWFETMPAVSDTGKDYRAAKNWLPHSSYILRNDMLSSMFLYNTDPKGWFSFFLLFFFCFFLFFYIVFFFAFEFVRIMLCLSFVLSPLLQVIGL